VYSTRASRAAPIFGTVCASFAPLISCSAELSFLSREEARSVTEIVPTGKCAYCPCGLVQPQREGCTEVLPRGVTIDGLWIGDSIC
jgi:hypothetical protein